MKILLVDDSSQSREDIRLLLAKQLGLDDVIISNECGEGLNRVIEYTLDDGGMAALFGTKKAAKRCAINLVLLKWDIRGLSPYDFLKEARKMFDKKTLPVIVITSGNNKEDIMKAVDAGANNFVISPVNSEILNRKIAEVMGKSVTAEIKKPLQAEQVKTGGVSWYGKVEDKAKEKKEPQRLIGAFYDTSKTGGTAQQPKTDMSKVDMSQKIDGHYHEKVNVVGGGTNCYWAKDVDGKDMVNLEYVTAKGRPSGIHVKVIPKTDFLSQFTLCTEDTCQILKRLKDS
jgi:two-component system chemotaxis response regulator CheY